MRTKKMKYLWFVVILAVFCLTLFLARTRSKVEMRNRLYRQWTEHYLVTDGKQSYVRTTNSDQETVVLSEAQGYGMLITVEAAKKDLANQEDFDRLYRYYQNNRLDDTQLMAWKQIIKKGELSSEHQNATDGDLYIAYALMEAAKQWPEKGKGYQQQAKAILDDILKYNYNETTGVLTVGNWANQDSEFYHLMRTSDTLPSFFQSFYELTGNEQWLSIKEKMLAQLDAISSQTKTGLLPYNLAQSQDKTSQKLGKKMLDFFMKQRNIYAGYDLKGNALHQYQAASFIAPVSYAAENGDGYLKLVQQNKFIFMQDLSTENYYDATMTTMIALQLF